MVGILALNRFMRIKTRHRMILNGMYVAQEVRGKGVGRLILQEAIRYAKSLRETGLEELILAVTVGNNVSSG
jgi:GNAT superfamily N-acetyltransferase